MKIFLIVRDGGTFIAKQRGVNRNTYYFPVPFIDDDKIISYFFHKRDKLICHVETGVLPEMCNEQESWGGKKCELFCEVRDICGLL